ncbi:MAG: hypothetical protein LWX56_02435 [Ignavibacteria bacterium]|nr:hypothetical protein [Ignavibacteria bacterium]
MGKMFWLLCGYVFFISCNTIFAQNECTSQYLSQVFHRLPAECRQARSNDTLAYFTRVTDKIMPGRTMPVLYYYTRSQLSDIGIRLCDSSSLRAIVNNEIVCRFFERKMLELLVNLSSETIADNEQIHLLVNRNQVIQRKQLFLFCETMIRATKLEYHRDSLFARLVGVSGNNVAEFQFRVSNYLLRAHDKSELDSLMYKELTSFHTGSQTPKETIPGLYSAPDSIIVSKGKFLFTEKLNQDLYHGILRKKEYLIFSRSYFPESFCNLLQHPSLSDSISIEVQHYQYNGKAPLFTMAFQDFAAYFSDHEFYTGIIRSAADKLQVLVIVYNKDLNVYHFFTTQPDAEQFFKGKKKFHIDFHTNIPSDTLGDITGVR